MKISSIGTKYSNGALITEDTFYKEVNMPISNITAAQTAALNSSAYTTKAKDEEETTTKKSDFSEEAAVYEKSADASKVSEKSAKKTTDRSAIIAQLKADAEQQKKNLMDIVTKTIQGQGKSFAIATEDDMWKFLASGNFTVDADTKAQAEKDIAEDGYYGVEKTSDRILDFAKAISGGDTSKADELIEAFKKGFKEATKTWGQDLPDISQKTYDKVLEKFEEWKNGTEISDSTDET